MVVLRDSKELGWVRNSVVFAHWWRKIACRQTPTSAKQSRRPVPPIMTTEAATGSYGDLRVIPNMQRITFWPVQPTTNLL